MKCPTCNSPNPKLHPAMQFEGEVQICSDAFHSPREAQYACGNCGKPIKSGCFCSDKCRDTDDVNTP